MRWYLVTSSMAYPGKGAIKKRLAVLSEIGDTFVVYSEKFGEDNSVNRSIFAIEAIAKSDGVVLVQSGGDSPVGEAELGLALGMNKRIVVIGERRSDFHYLPTVEFYRTQKAFIETRTDEVEANAD